MTDQPRKLKYTVDKRVRATGLWETLEEYAPKYNVDLEERKHRFLFWTWTEIIETIHPNPSGEKVNLRSALSFARQVWDGERRRREPMDVRVVVHDGYAKPFIWWKNGRFCDSY